MNNLLTLCIFMGLGAFFVFFNLLLGKSRLCGLETAFKFRFSLH